jgi:hypothetical protein
VSDVCRADVETKPQRLHRSKDESQACARLATLDLDDPLPADADAGASVASSSPSSRRRPESVLRCLWRFGSACQRSVTSADVIER